MKKLCQILSLSLLLAMLLSVNAFAATADGPGYGDSWPETKTETAATDDTGYGDTWSEIRTDTTENTTTSETTNCDSGELDPIPATEPEGDIGIPPREISNWLTEQIRLEVNYCEVYGTNATTVVHLRLSDATKIIFIADQLCPRGYTDDGGFFASDVGIPCGINRQLYRYLSTTTSAAAMYDFGGAATLMAKYSPEELAAIYADLREAALPYQGELIEWLDNFSTTIRVPNYGTLWNGIIVPQPKPTDEKPIDELFPAIEPIEGTAPTVVAIP